MKKLISILLFATSILPIHAFADWVQLGEGKGTTLYLDPAKTAPIDSITKRAVILLSYQDKQQVGKGNPYTSVVSRIEVDCRQMRYKAVANYYYVEAMGKGDLSSTSNIPLHEQEWQYPAPNSAMDEAISQACSKK